MKTPTLQGIVDRIALLVPDRPWARHMAPNGTVAKIGTRDRWIVTLTCLDHGVEVSARRPRERRDERLDGRILVEDDLDALASPLADIMTWWADRLTVYSLVPGRLYRIGKELVDHYRDVFHVGVELSFVERHFLPHDGGHTVVFKLPDGAERRMYLQEGEVILEDLDAYLIEV
jgi:hypothetical protein